MKNACDSLAASALIMTGLNVEGNFENSPLRCGKVQNSTRLITENGDFGKRSTSNRSKIRLSSGARHDNDVVITWISWSWGENSYLSATEPQKVGVLRQSLRNRVKLAVRPLSSVQKTPPRLGEAAWKALRTSLPIPLVWWQRWSNLPRSRGACWIQVSWNQHWKPP